MIDFETEEQAPLVNLDDKGVLTASPEDPLLPCVHQVMGIDTDGDKAKYDLKAKDILEWAKGQTEDHSPENLKWIIRDMEMKIGSPAVGERAIDYLHSYIGLSEQKRDIEKKLKKYNPFS